MEYTEIASLMPHDAHVGDRVIPAGGQAEALYQVVGGPYMVDGVEVVDIVVRAATALPAPVEGRLLLAPWPVPLAARGSGRTDLVVNVDHRRGEDGRVAGAPRLGRVLPILEVPGRYRVGGRLTVIRGLPGAGKSTAAAGLGGVVFSRDQLRAELITAGYFAGEMYDHRRGDEALVSAELTIRAVRLLVAGAHVIIDGTHLADEQIAPWRAVAGMCRVPLDIHDVTTGVEECVRRDAQRTGLARVGEAVIRRMAADSGWGGPHISTLPTRPGRRRAVVADIDGTIGVRVPGPDGTVRSPYLEGQHRVGEDAPVPVVIERIRREYEAGYAVVVTSGRSEEFEAPTRAWLDEHLGVPYTLYMRAAGDERPDAAVKRDLYVERIHGEFEIAVVYDDRNQVVRAWRDLGLTVFQVADGDF